MTHSGEPPPEKPADTNRVRMLRRSGFVALLCAALACAASAANENWAAVQIRAVTQIGVLGSSVSSFAPQSPLTQGALATAVAAVDTLQHPAAPKPEPPALTSTVGPDATIAGSAPVDVEVTGPDLDHVDFAVDGVGTSTSYDSPYELDLDTTQLADGPHSVAGNVSFAGGRDASATRQVTIATANTTTPYASGRPGGRTLAQWR